MARRNRKLSISVRSLITIRHNTKTPLNIRLQFIILFDPVCSRRCQRPASIRTRAEGYARNSTFLFARAFSHPPMIHEWNGEKNVIKISHYSTPKIFKQNAKTRTINHNFIGRKFFLYFFCSSNPHTLSPCSSRFDLIFCFPSIIYENFQNNNSKRKFYPKCRYLVAIPCYLVDFFYYNCNHKRSRREEIKYLMADFSVKIGRNGMELEKGDRIQAEIWKKQQ